MKLEGQHLLKWLLKCCKLAHDSLNFLAILRGGKIFSRGGQLPPPLPHLGCWTKSHALGCREIGAKLKRNLYSRNLVCAFGSNERFFGNHCSCNEISALSLLSFIC